MRAEVAPEQVLPAPFSAVMAESMVPVTHILWSHLWLGIATDAFDRARAFVRASAKRTPGETPPAAIRLSHLMSELSLLRSEVRSALEEFVEASRGARTGSGSRRCRPRFASTTSRSRRRAGASRLPGAMGVCGIVGFKNDTPFSVGRHLRDTMSASLMIANERIHQTNASLLLIAKDV